MAALRLAFVTFAVCAVLAQALVPPPPYNPPPPYTQTNQVGEATHLPICRDLVSPTGTPCEEYSVVAEDGFILSLIHLPPIAPNSPVVYLQHGLLGAASVWLDQPSGNESLAYVLRNAGYDVWAGNSRGNWYSLQSTKYTINDKAFWESIDFDTMAKYDLPAFINFILKKTSQKTLAYVGHSQGTTQLFAALSKGYGSLCSQISVFVALAPVTRAKNIITPAFKQLAAIHADTLLTLFGWQSFPPLNMNAMTVLEKINVTCDSTDRSLCENIVYDIGGATQSWVNRTQMKTDLGFDPAGTSMRNMQHWLQNMRSDDFKQYNYGAIGNLFKYGTITTPTYKLSNVCVPTAFFSGTFDQLAAPADVAWTISQLPPAKVKYQSILPYQHNDFVWSINAKTELYPYILEQLRQGIPSARLLNANQLLNINKKN